jgi:hypothetical protein
VVLSSRVVTKVDSLCENWARIFVGMSTFLNRFQLPPLPAELVEQFSGRLTELDLRRKVKVKHAAAVNDLSEASFRRHYSHLIEKITARRDGVMLLNALTLPPPQED